MGKGDQFIVVSDGLNPEVRAWMKEYPRVDFYELPIRFWDFGSTSCDFARSRATGDMIWYVGDDDYPAKGVFSTIRRRVKGQTKSAHVFAMKHGETVLKDSTDLGRVSGQQIVVPNDPDLPKMQRSEGDRLLSTFPDDFVFIGRCVAKYGAVYHDDVICTLTRQNGGVML